MPGRATAAPPSLTRRVVAAVVGAFAAVFVVLYAVLWYESMAPATGDFDRGLQQTAETVLLTLDRIDSVDAARMAIALGDAANAGQMIDAPPSHLLLQRRDGSLRLHTGPPGTLGALDARTLAAGASRLRVEGRETYAHVAVGQRWVVAVLDGAPERSRWLGWVLFSDLATYLTLALPIVLLPVWWAARTAMQPLRELSDEVAARHALDTRALGSRKRWRELAPLEDALNQLFARTAHSVAREKAFVHDAAHELRTPLAVIATHAHVLAARHGAGDPGALDDDRGTAAARLQAAVQRASHLTQQLLQLARADAPPKPASGTVDLMNLLRDAMALQAERAAAQGSELELQGPDQLPLAADARLLRSIIDNLLDNALRYGGTGAAVRVRVQRAGPWLLLQVADSGPGIAAADREQVFERFWRGVSTEGPTPPGSGLGLAIVREAARSLGGDAEVLPQAAGTTLQVRLPHPAGAGPAAP